MSRKEKAYQPSAILGIPLDITVKYTRQAPHVTGWHNIQATTLHNPLSKCKFMKAGLLTSQQYSRTIVIVETG